MNVILFNKLEAEAIFLINDEEISNTIDSNEKLGVNIEIPEKKYECSKITFRIKEVSYVYVNKEGDLNVLISGEVWTLRYDKELYKTIRRELNE